LKILFIGDVMGRSGREALQEHLPQVKEKLKPDVVIVNGENAASGAGITPKICEEFYSWGVDVITTGNHVWDQREIIPYIDKDQKLLRPANFPDGTPGLGATRHELDDGRVITVINAMGRLFMDSLDDPFRIVKELVEKEKMGKSTHAIFVDFHAEATSEKLSLAHYLDGKISGLVGTHTHVPTADAHIMPGGTAYMSDAGMTGDYNSVIGVEKDIAIHRFVKKFAGERMRPAAGKGAMCGVYIVTNDKTGHAERVEPVRMGAVISEHIPKI
jgi:metallophosphoesterase (TIGR00282 family)